MNSCDIQTFQQNASGIQFPFFNEISNQSIYSLTGMNSTLGEIARKFPENVVRMGNIQNFHEIIP